MENNDSVHIILGYFESVFRPLEALLREIYAHFHPPTEAFGHNLNTAARKTKS